MRWWQMWLFHKRAAEEVPPRGPECMFCGGYESLEWGQCARCRALDEGSCTACGHSSRWHEVRWDDHHHAWWECYLCHPQRLGAPGVPVAMNDWWADRVKLAQHAFVSGVATRA